METMQINLKIPLNLFNSAQKYAKEFGFQNIQDLARASLREKINKKVEYDNTFTKRELKLIEKFANKLMEERDFVSEKELYNNLSK